MCPGQQRELLSANTVIGIAKINQVGSAFQVLPMDETEQANMKSASVVGQLPVLKPARMVYKKK